jgi:hypothetical protein
LIVNNVGYFNDLQCLEADDQKLATLTCSDAVSERTCKAITGACCLWRNNSCQSGTIASTDTCVSITSASVVCCRLVTSSGEACTYDSNNSQCVATTDNVKYDCDSAGLNKEACLLKVGGKKCKWVTETSRCIELTKVEENALTCPSTLTINRDTCTGINTTGLYC